MPQEINVEIAEIVRDIEGTDIKNIIENELNSLQKELDYLFMHPKYYVIQNMLNGYSPSSILKILKDKEKELSHSSEVYSLSIIDLKIGSNFKRLKQILKEFKEFSDLADIFEIFEFSNEFDEDEWKW